MGESHSVIPDLDTYINHTPVLTCKTFDQMMQSRFYFKKEIRS